MANKSKSQLNPKVKRFFTETEVGALLEDVDQKLGMIIEGQAGLTQRVGRVENRLETVVDTIGEVKIEITEMTGDIREINEKLDRKADSSHVKRLEHRVSILEAK